MGRGLVAALGLSGVLFLAIAGAAPSASPTTWPLADARETLLATQPFVALDAAQADRPRFWVDVDRLPKSAVRGLGAPVVVRGVRTWRSFRFAGRVSDLLTGTRPDVTFVFSFGVAGRVRLREFHGPPPNTHQPSLPVRGAFYYGWFPELWAQGAVSPYTHYRPSLGLYSSGDPTILRRHVEAMRYGGLAAGIWSWWGIGDPTDIRLPTALGVARPTPFRWAIYHEREGYEDLEPEEIRRDLAYVVERYGSKPAYLRIDGRPVVFVYSADDRDCSVVDRWSRGNPGGVYLVLKVFGGYRECTPQPDGWHQYGTSFTSGISRHEGYSTTIMPGFWFVENPASPFPRDLERWRGAIREMAASGDPFQLIVSFNEWPEGTAVESAVEWDSPSGYGAYVDVLHEELAAPP